MSPGACVGRPAKGAMVQGEKRAWCNPRTRGICCWGLGRRASGDEAQGVREMVLMRILHTCKNLALLCVRSGAIAGFRVEEQHDFVYT